MAKWGDVSEPVHLHMSISEGAMTSNAESLHLTLQVRAMPDGLFRIGSMEPIRMVGTGRRRTECTG